MKRPLLVLALVFFGGMSATTAKAENKIGIWRWLGMGWGPGYHSGENRHGQHFGHRQGSHSPGVYPAWGASWPTEEFMEPATPWEPSPRPEPAPHFEPAPGADLEGEVHPPEPEAKVRRLPPLRSALVSAPQSELEKEPKNSVEVNSSRRARTLP